MFCCCCCCCSSLLISPLTRSLSILPPSKSILFQVLEKPLTACFFYRWIWASKVYPLEEGLVSWAISVEQVHLERLRFEMPPFGPLALVNLIMWKASCRFLVELGLLLLLLLLKHKVLTSSLIASGWNVNIPFRSLPFAKKRNALFLLFKYQHHKFHLVVFHRKKKAYQVSIPLALWWMAVC